jgi:hypothetical protein
MDLSSEDAVGIKICWKGPKGNKTCITISNGLTSLKMETLDLRAGETSDGFMALSGFPRDVEGESFLIDAPQKIGDGMMVSPGEYTIQKGMVNLRIQEVKMGERK